MVKEVTAYEAEDGSVHPTEFQAALHDCRAQLKRLSIFNEGTVSAIINSREEVFTALEGLMKAIPDTKDLVHEQLASPPSEESR